MCSLIPTGTRYFAFMLKKLRTSCNLVLLITIFVFFLIKNIGGTDYKCEVCNKKFTKRSALEVHSRVHTGIKPYRCNICTKTFSIHGNLKRHLLIHSGERPYICLKCSKCFNNSSHLTRHIKAKHPAEWKTYIKVKLKIAVAIEYFNKTQNNRHSENCKHFNSLRFD